MAQKAKKRELTIDEEKDIFLSFINKKTRNNRKKLEQIDELSKKDKSTLKPEQIDKINSKAEVLESVKYYDKIKDMYYEAQKAAKEEGKEETTETIKKEESQPEPKKTVSEPVEEKVSSSAILLKVLNLAHFAQLFNDSHKRDEFRSKFDKNDPDFDVFYEFYTKVFTFSEGDKFERVESKINTSLHELDLYLNSTDRPALRNKTYKQLHECVERIVGTSLFKDQKANISVPKTGTSTHQISAIGSELRQEKSQQAPEEPRGLADLRAESNIISKKEEQKEQSPIKQPVEREKQPEAIPVEQIEREQRAQQSKRWADVQDEEEQGEEEDEDEEGDEGEEEEKQQGGASQEKPDDGFITVKSKVKEKKPEGEGGQRGTRRGGRGGRRGGRGRGEFRGRGGDRPRKEGEGQGQPTEGGEGFRGGRGGKFQFKKKYVEKEGERKPEEHRESH